MSRVNKVGGHRLQNIQSNDLQQKLTYQQLLNINHDLTKENMQLKNIGTRLGQQLRMLHNQFEIKPRDQSTELYHAIGSHPILHQYENTLIPLLDAYEIKIQEFEHGFQKMHEQFFSLEKKFEEVCLENEELRGSLAEKIKQIIQIYRNGINQEMQSDFGRLILDQINEKQRCLVEENNYLEKEYIHYKAQTQKMAEQLSENKHKLQENAVKLRQMRLKQREYTSEIQILKEQSLDGKIKYNELEKEKRKVEQGHERVLSSNSQITKQKQLYKNRLYDLRNKLQKQNPQHESDQRPYIQELKTKIQFLEAQQPVKPKETKINREYDQKIKEKNRQIEHNKIKVQQLQEFVQQLKSSNNAIESEKNQLQTQLNKIQKSYHNIQQKAKQDILRLKKQQNIERERQGQQLKNKVEERDNRILQLEDSVYRMKIEQDRLHKQNKILMPKSPRSPKSSRIFNSNSPSHHFQNNAQRTIQKLKQKLSTNQQVFREQIQIFQNDLNYLKKQSDTFKQQCKNKTQELNKLRSQYGRLNHECQSAKREKAHIVEEFKVVRNEHEHHLNEKQAYFNKRIQQIRNLVAQSEQRRKKQKMKVQQATRQYKRVLQDLKNTYQSRISHLQTQMTTPR